MKSDQKKLLRAQAHALKPVVITGQAGLSEAVLNEINLALEHHELIKVRLNAADREARKEMSDRICTELKAELVQTLGHIAVIYRLNPEKH
ncbi:ribosome assembly RNA-binding protein YhbY [Methylococcus sp. EFPC2]|uniref:ribosome assembly RNA-binding protein YhbY n=1 Tax=Methylococcus sp. EFPC2 TaxID=2812648 RepID=UPI001966EF2E|nr:ribosome assembly RNA-binding protein YhbY [Methylococcus sp. EFPC2]QSA98925.1 ribosome assembly RNA-binding protein YhbY [Methylococcus sp. EFPC2]